MSPTGFFDGANAADLHREGGSAIRGGRPRGQGDQGGGLRDDQARACDDARQHGARHLKVRPFPSSHLTYVPTSSLDSNPSG